MELWNHNISVYRLKYIFGTPAIQHSINPLAVKKNPNQLLELLP